MIMFCLPSVILAANNWYSNAESSSSCADYENIINKDVDSENSAVDFEEKINRNIDRIIDLRNTNYLTGTKTVVSLGGTPAPVPPAPVHGSGMGGYNKIPAVPAILMGGDNIIPVVPAVPATVGLPPSPPPPEPPLSNSDQYDHSSW